MALHSVGLSTWRWNNNLKSIVLLAAFPVLLLLLVWGIAFVTGLLTVDPQGYVRTDNASGQSFLLLPRPMTPFEMSLWVVMSLWPWVLGLAAGWMLIGYAFHSSMIMSMTGARAVARSEEPRLYNLLENLCIARGLRMPKLYVMDSPELNAFATGLNERNYAITVTRGLMEDLDDRELEAVLGHELTHIINRDVRLLIVTIVFTGMISFLAQMMWRSVQMASFRRDDDRRGRGTLIVIIAAIMLAVGYLLAILLRFALSRRREYLADAGAVELTRDPDAMIGALRKIAGRAAMPAVPSEVRQMFIENPPALSGLFGLFATHPRIEDRIRVLERMGGGTSIPKGESVIPRAN